MFQRCPWQIRLSYMSLPLSWGVSVALWPSLMVISSYALFKDLRKLRYVELLTYVAVNDFLFSICSLLGNVKEGSFDCYFQGIIGSASVSVALIDDGNHVPAVHCLSRWENTPTSEVDASGWDYLSSGFCSLTLDN